MTLVIGYIEDYRYGIAADGRVLQENTIVTDWQQKTFQVGDTLLGVAGELATITELTYLDLPTDGTLIPFLRAHFKPLEQHSSIMLVDRHGIKILDTFHGAVSDITLDFAVMGSGADVAYGYLILEHECVSRIERAFSLARDRCAGVGPIRSKTEIEFDADE